MSNFSEHSCLASFPEFARVNRIIAKEKFYDRIDYATKILFQQEIARITWQYKLAPDTINLSAKTWPELEVFQIELKNHEIPMKTLKVIDLAIPYPILFVITKGSAEKIVISYKEVSSKNTGAVKVDTYFMTDWNDPKLGQIKIDGLSIDAVYNNFIRQVAGEKLRSVAMTCKNNSGKNSADSADYTNPTESMDDGMMNQRSGSARQDIANLQNDIETMKERERIQKQIDALDRKFKAEPSIGKRQRLAEERYKLMKQL